MFKTLKKYIKKQTYVHDPSAQETMSRDSTFPVSVIKQQLSKRPKADGTDEVSHASNLLFHPDRESFLHLGHQVQVTDSVSRLCHADTEESLCDSHTSSYVLAVTATSQCIWSSKCYVTSERDRTHEGMKTKVWYDQGSSCVMER